MNDAENVNDAEQYVELHELAARARRRAAAARDLAAERRRRAGGALAGRQLAYAQGLLDSACWLDAAAEAEDRRAVQLEIRRTHLAGPPRAAPPREAPRQAASDR